MIRNYLNQRREELSFTAWILKCISQAISENKPVQAIRKGQNKLIIFDNIDISNIVEKEVRGEKVPLPLIIRKVNAKTLKEIHYEIKSAKVKK